MAGETSVAAANSRFGRVRLLYSDGAPDAESSKNRTGSRRSLIGQNQDLATADLPIGDANEVAALVENRAIHVKCAAITGVRLNRSREMAPLQAQNARRARKRTLLVG